MQRRPSPARFLLRFALCYLALALGLRASRTPELIEIDAPFPMPALAVPQFPDRDFVVTDYGAKPDGETDISAAIKDAIAACHAAGGGRVVIPAGRWFTGKVHLRSNVNLHLAEGAVLRFSDRPEDYLPAVQTSWEGMECFNYSPLIYAFECENIALSGRGTIEAKLDTWKIWFARPPAHMEALKQLYHFMSKGVPVAERQMAVGENHLRPHFVQFNRCRNILIEDISIRNSPFWTIHLLLCDTAIVRRIDVSADGHNNDGIDPEMTRNLLIEDCVFDQGDDAVAIKAGRNQDGWRLNTPTENIVIRRCVMKRGHQLVAIGSEIAGGVRNVFVTDCKFDNQPDDPPQHILFIKTNRRMGGFVENIYVDGITARSTRNGVFGIETDVLYQWRNLVPSYEERLTRIQGIHFRNVTVDETDIPFRILGDALRPVRDISIENVTIKKIRGVPSRYENVEPVREYNVNIAGRALRNY